VAGERDDHHGRRPPLQSLEHGRTLPAALPEAAPVVDDRSMRVDAMVHGTGIAELAANAAGREAEGYDGLWTAETAHDPFLSLMPVAEHTSRVNIGTAIAVAFARSPMTMAYSAYDLQVHSGGRFLLGLGSQVRPHIERRFAMPWGQPAARMREYIEALRAIWAAWETGERLNFRGEFYAHTLMTPFFTPAPSPWGPPKVYLAAVGDHMTRTAGEVCDGIMPHPFTTERYLRERTLPILEGALAESGRTFADFTVSFSGFVVTGRTAEEMSAAADAVKKQIAFYGSTPSYRQVLDLHGWGELGVELNRLSRGTDDDRWQRMASLVDDEVLAAFAVVGEPDKLGAALLARYGGIVDRFTFYDAYPHDDALFTDAIATLRAA
jgi:probable F420-dependent oxidoreductase